MHKFDVLEEGKRLQEASKALVLIHGRGATAENILPLAGFFTDESWYVAAPQATNFQWYPHSFMMPVSQNEPWLSSAVDYVKKIIDNISKQIPEKNIYLMGFSQGACLSVEVAARYATRYGGIAAFTGGLIGSEPGYDKYNGSFDGTRIYISNGDNDPHIPQSRTEETRDQLVKMGADVTLDIFPGRDHTILEDELEKAKSFIL